MACITYTEKVFFYRKIMYFTSSKHTFTSRDFGESEEEKVKPALALFYELRNGVTVDDDKLEVKSCLQGSQLFLSVENKKVWAPDTYSFVIFKSKSHAGICMFVWNQTTSCYSNFCLVCYSFCGTKGTK